MASAVANYPYLPPKEGNKGNFLELQRGEDIEDVKLLDGGWWYGKVTRNGSTKTGYFPSTYVTLNERAPSAKQASDDGGAMRRSNSKTLARMMSNGSTEGSVPQMSGSMSRRGSINKLRMMAYGTTSDLVENKAITSNVRVGATTPDRRRSGNSPMKGTDRVLLRKSSTSPNEFVDERIMKGEVHQFEEPEEVISTPQTDKGSASPAMVFRLKDDATNSYFTFKDGVYAWVTED
mmetsp:Transcript_13641/g.22518  ORF Transcript_13641/g.22518 Transcript_13641/m.22518 type:complete len:234 (+) Transcript_13641:47-748(+)|eukprot:CAMPEP_0114426700 /NCGR_PEP_ID=MMETSP0103-20121206/7942_1 /TAXON_ID=37642 ORGANISM="Paraphysomonas imperforata, Strain PA2" /NCGR_SAMPLE_ID=MMETSP0103 /ASSEMBLY_ACC=CAM_ASM_000201 /LENGTH=233 /DNA_ID=CAMNT_0001595687 /DNA_START=240 /DNA_END=941 /DNA_ORIENTATION=+